MHHSENMEYPFYPKNEQAIKDWRAVWLWRPHQPQGGKYLAVLVEVEMYRDLVALGIDLWSRVR
jgi:hypothetical protein